MNDKASEPRRLSDIVASLEGQKDLTIGALVDAFGERAFGALMFVFALPNVIPAPPGTSAILGLPLVILTFQLMIGRQALWLPQRLRSRPISGAMVDSFAKKMIPAISHMERILRPRLSLFAATDTAERFIGLVTFALAVILFLPIPLVNILPAAAISCIALGLAERDGLAVLLGYALAAVTLLLLATVSSAIYQAVIAFFEALFGG